MKGYAGRILDVDLASRTFGFHPLDEATARLYLGGKGYGTPATSTLGGQEG